MTRKIDDDTAASELIGVRLSIVESKNPSAVGLTGTVVDETKNTLVIQTKSGEKRIEKSPHVFKINNKTINGSLLVSRPEERIKKWLRRKHQRHGTSAFK